MWHFLEMGKFKRVITLNRTIEIAEKLALEFRSLFNNVESIAVSVDDLSAQSRYLAQADAIVTATKSMQVLFSANDVKADAATAAVGSCASRSPHCAF